MSVKYFITFQIKVSEDIVVLNIRFKMALQKFTAVYATLFLTPLLAIYL